jgi:hypothetical protein
MTRRAQHDWLLRFLLRPRVRVWRRWSSVVTAPAAVVLGATGHVHTGALVIGVRVALYALVVALAWRLEGVRGDALRDLLMHPRARAFLRAERDVVLTLPLLVARTISRRRAPEAFRYAARGDRVPMALALTPVVVTEAVPVYLLLPREWVSAHLISVAVHAYALIWLWAWALGPRAWPHAVRDATLVVRVGPFYRAQVPLTAIREITVERRRVANSHGALTTEDDRACLAAGGRVDVMLQLATPVRIEQPLHEPVTMTQLALPSDDPDAFARELARAATERGAQRSRRGILTVAPLLLADELTRS